MGIIINVQEHLQECYQDEDITLLCGFDDAFLGVGSSFDKFFACYSKRKIIKNLMDVDCMTYDEAMEYFDFNISGAFVGERTPVIIDDMW